MLPQPHCQRSPDCCATRCQRFGVKQRCQSGFWFGPDALSRPTSCRTSGPPHGMTKLSRVGYARHWSPQVVRPNLALHLTQPRDWFRAARRRVVVVIGVVAGPVSCKFGHTRLHERACGGGGRMVRTASDGRVVLRVVPVGAGAAHRREVRLGLASGVRRHGASGRWRSARPHRSRGHSGCAVLSVWPGTAEGIEPNPARRLTPPSDLGRIAHRVMAVQVSFMFGRAASFTRHTLRCGGRVVPSTVGGCVARGGLHRRGPSERMWWPHESARVAASGSADVPRWRGHSGCAALRRTAEPQSWRADAIRGGAPRPNPALHRTAVYCAVFRPCRSHRGR
ncbi:hypothetical protein GobsT_37380 [Gemmata obscuriglobus]|nr:hypothetical protein GobsT_37380 [Gemmata obscuriglobus]VTS07473.1 unnamed protein product [Gemmata obscuriglobus UQM 2246]